MNRNITLSAEAEAIDLARREAQSQKTTLNALFREWLEGLAGRTERRAKVAELFKQMDDYDSGGPFSREDMNRP
ncbi:MAG: hypothetical protein P1U90_08150 [Akkermansiaceae bacterium]|jgi:hypothetical protein|nr:hypothetical protein [Akkermansiaceae bacterium]